MGGQRSYLKTGGFTEFLYHQVGETISAGGVEGKVIARFGSDGNHDGLPMYSNTSEVYLKMDNKNKQIEQARIYRNRKPVIDIDWGHAHDGFKKGVAHVHEWQSDGNGNPVRTGRKRHMNNQEIIIFGPLLRKAYTSIKFR